MSVRRGAGFCLRKGCSAYSQPFFLLEAPDAFECPVCLRPGLIESERARRDGADRFVGEVRIDFDFDPARRVYRKRALMMDGRTHGRQATFTLQSPLIDSHERAVRIGRLMMRSLNQRSGAKSDDAQRAPTRNQLIGEGWSVLA